MSEMRIERGPVGGILKVLNAKGEELSILEDGEATLFGVRGNPNEILPRIRTSEDLLEAIAHHLGKEVK